MINGTMAGIAASAFVAGAVLTVLVLGIGSPPPTAAISEITPAAGGDGGDARRRVPPALRDADQDPKNRVVAVVDGQSLRFKDLEAHKQMMPSELRELPVQVIYAALLEQAITGELLAAAGRKLDLHRADEVRDRIAFIEDRLIQSAYVARLTEEARKTPVSEDAIQTRYLAFLEAHEPVDEVRARHILVETRKEAVDIVRRLETGADFAELAKKTSKGPSASYGGDLGYFTHGEMETPFANAAFALSAGEFTREPVKTKFGWHVIAVEDRRKKDPPSLDEMRAKLVDEIAQENVQKSIDHMRAAVAIERYNPDGSPMQTIPAEERAQTAGETAAGQANKPSTYPNGRAE